MKTLAACLPHARKDKSKLAGLQFFRLAAAARRNWLLLHLVGELIDHVQFSMNEILEFKKQ